MHSGIAPVVDKNSNQQAVWSSICNVEREIAADRGKAARLDDIGENIGAHLRAPIAQFPQAARRHVSGNDCD